MYKVVTGYDMENLVERLNELPKWLVENEGFHCIGGPVCCDDGRYRQMIYISKPSSP